MPFWFQIRPVCVPVSPRALVEADRAHLRGRGDRRRTPVSLIVVVAVAGVVGMRVSANSCAAVEKFQLTVEASVAPSADVAAVLIWAV